MSQLGDFLELVHGPRPGFRTVRATIRHWRSGEPTIRYADARPLGRRKATAVEPKHPDHEAILKVWFAPPHKIRIERVSERDGRFERLTVQNATQWWDRDHEGHVESGERGDDHRSRPSFHIIDAERHFGDSELREFVGEVSLEAVGTITCAGQECVRVNAVTREDKVGWSHCLSSGADSAEIHADPERGVVLGLLAFAGGDLFESHVVQEVAFDEPLDDALFTYEPQRGEQVRKPDVITERMTLAAAVARMTFRVLVPTDPELVATPGEVRWHPPRLGCSPYLMLTYPDGPLIMQSDTGWGDEDYERESVTRNGRVLEISDAGEEGGRLIWLTHLGTHVQLISDLPRERLLDIAASLEPAKAS